MHYQLIGVVLKHVPYKRQKQRRQIVCPLKMCLYHYPQHKLVYEVRYHSR